MRKLFSRFWRYNRAILGNERGSSGRKDRESAAKQQEDIARQKEEIRAIGDEALSQLAAGSPERAQLQAFVSRMVEQASSGPFAVAELGGAVLDQQEAVRRFSQQLVSQQQEKAARGEAITPLEARTDIAFGGVREAAKPTSEEQDIFNVLRGTVPSTPAGEQFRELLEMRPDLRDSLNALAGESVSTPAGEVFERIVGQAGEEVRPEDILPEGTFDFESTFPEQLELLQDAVNRQAIRRGEGVFSGGIPLETLGRTGLELAVAEAEQRRAARIQEFQAQQQARQQAQAENAQALSQFGSVLDIAGGAEGTQADRLMTLFNLAEQLRNRQIGVEEANVSLQSGRESELNRILAEQTAASTANTQDLLSAQNLRAQGLRDLASSLREAERQMIQRAIIPDVSASFGPFSVEKSPNKAFEGVPTTPAPVGPVSPGRTSAAGLQASRQGTNTGINVDLTGLLSSRKPAKKKGAAFNLQDPAQLEQLYRSLGMV